MAKSKIAYAKDASGKEMMIKDGTYQIMMEWEKPYIKACVEAIEPKGDVLEVGFGLGYSASEIQKHAIKSHTIIESEPEIVKKAKLWAKGKKNVRIVQGTWQEELEDFGKFDAIFFNDYLLVTQEQIEEGKAAIQTYKKMVKDAKELQKDIQAVLQMCEGRTFSDQDLKHLLKHVFTTQFCDWESVSGFIEDLAHTKSITKKQKEMFLKDFRKKLQEKELDDVAVSLHNFDPRYQGDRFIYFVEECLDKHMKPKAKLSAFMETPTSKRKHPEFAKRILSRKDIRYSEKVIQVKVPKNCAYYSDSKALVIVIEKK